VWSVTVTTNWRICEARDTPARCCRGKSFAKDQEPRMSRAKLLACGFAAITALGATTALAAPIPSAGVYRARDGGRGAALFLSGDGAWNLGVVDMAKAMAAHGVTVIGLDWPAYLKVRDGKSACLDLAKDLQDTAAAAGIKTPPLLIGYSSGATAVYGALAQARPGQFAGGVSLGFGPDLMTKQPFCEGAGLTYRADPKLGYVYAPRKDLGARWIALQGLQDQVISPAATRAFVARTPTAEAVMLPKVGHGFSVERNWMAPFLQAVTALSATGAPSNPHGG
jgi:type IV secretory pathway VirJ component